MRALRGASLFAGVGGFDLAAERLGWRTVWASEIEVAARDLFARRFPTVPLLGDVRRITAARVARYGRLDALWAGFPCQDLSVAGKRAGLKGKRSALFFQIVRLAAALDPRFLFLENVEGLRSNNGGRDLALILGALVGATCDVPAGGWASAGVADGPAGLAVWRVLDTEFYGLPQRRERWYCIVDRRARGVGPAPVLLEPARLLGHSVTRRETRARLARGAAARALGRVGGGDDPGANKGTVVAANPVTTKASGGKDSPNLVVDVAQTLAGGARGKKGGQSLDDVPLVVGVDVAPTLGARDGKGPGNFQNGALQAVILEPTADPIVAREGSTYTHEGNNLRARNLVLQGTALGEEASPALRQGGRAQGAGSSTDNTPVVLAFEPRIARNDRGAPEPVAPPLKAQSGTDGRGDGAAVVFEAFEARVGRNGAGTPQPVAPSLKAHPSGGPGDADPLVFGFRPQQATGRRGASAPVPTDNLALPLTADSDKGDADPVIFDGLRPRRLTPLECERLQGFPDGWTCRCGAIDRTLELRGLAAERWRVTNWRSERLETLTAACTCKDGPRYRMLGNGVSVDVVEWIFRRFAAVYDVATT